MCVLYPLSRDGSVDKYSDHALAGGDEWGAPKLVFEHDVLRLSYLRGITGGSLVSPTAVALDSLVSHAFACTRGSLRAQELSSGTTR